MKVFLFDASRCNGCHGCQIACKDEHCGNDWMPYAKPQPETGHFWCGVEESVQGQVPKVRMTYQVTMCRHCEKCALVEAAPDAVHRRDDGLVIIDPTKVEGRKDLVDACPHHAVFWNEELEIPQKCTGCAHLVDAGETPRCVDFCQTGALRFGDEDEFAEELKDAVAIDAETGTKPRFYCLNLPKLFIGGDVWDPEPNEIVEGATVTLTAQDGSVRTTSTDDFGDFWFNRLDPGAYDLKIEAKGYQPVTKESIVLEQSLNLGDFPLKK